MNHRLRCVLAILVAVSINICVHAEDPYLLYEWKVTYGTLSPLGVPQRVIFINNQFPGPRINGTSNNNIIVNVFNQLDEPLLFTWSGIQQRKNSWQQGVLGSNCPIPPGTNFTYRFQVKDQIGSYYYYPSTSLHRAAGGYGPITVMSRHLIPVPFDQPPPEADHTVLVGDWFTKSHTELKTMLDAGRPLGRPAGIVINGKSGKGEPMFTLTPGKTYRFRFCNVGLKDSINVRIQGHIMRLVEIEGSHTVQNVYESLDIHLGQCFSVLLTADQEPKDYYIVASTRFTREPLLATATLRYANGKGPASPVLPTVPEGIAWSLNQFRSFRWNLTASAARPNPQGSFHYGQINITRTIKLVNTYGKVDGKLRYAVNGVSHVDSVTPMKLAEYYGVADKVFQYDLIKDEYAPAITHDGEDKITQLAPIVLNATYRNFVEIIFENPGKAMQSWHVSGHAFFAVAIEQGKWTPEKRKNYNLLDAISRNTIHVYPNSWAAIMLTFDNAGLWNLRSNALEKNYLGQQLYVSVHASAKSVQDEYNMPDNELVCGIVKERPRPTPPNKAP